MLSSMMDSIKHMMKPYATVGLAVFLLIGCIPPRAKVIKRTPKQMNAPPPLACCDAIGHNPNNIPFILGGNCFCTPSHRLVEAMHAAGHHLDVDYKMLVQMYRDAGIATDLDHRGCNNLCENGPHVAFGGRCMATPTPGTRNYERVISTTVAQIDSLYKQTAKEGVE